MRVLQPRISVEIRFRHVFCAKGLVLQLAKTADFLQKAIKIFWQDLYDDRAAQFSICLFLRTRRRDVAAFFIRQRCDLLHRVVKTDDLELNSGVANQFAIRLRRSRRFSRLGLSLFCAGKILWRCGSYFRRSKPHRAGRGFFV